MSSAALSNLGRDMDSGRWRCHILAMTEPAERRRAEMLADLDASDAEIAAGNLVSGEAVLATIEAAIDRLETRLERTPRPKAAPAR
jgi:hypothetical protein